MNIFKQQIQDRRFARIAKEQEVLKISEKITNLIGINPEDAEPDTVFEQLNHYDIRKERRAFTNGWEDLWEIVPKGFASAGYYGAVNPDWLQEQRGTATVNLPPPYCVKVVLDQLERMIVSA